MLLLSSGCRAAEIQSSPPSWKTQTMMTYIIIQWAQAPETSSRHLNRPACASFKAQVWKKEKKRQKSSNLDAQRAAC